ASRARREIARARLRIIGPPSLQESGQVHVDLVGVALPEEALHGELEDVALPDLHLDVAPRREPAEAVVALERHAVRHLDRRDPLRRGAPGAFDLEDEDVARRLPPEPEPRADASGGAALAAAAVPHGVLLPVQEDVEGARDRDVSAEEEPGLELPA